MYQLLISNVAQEKQSSDKLITFSVILNYCASILNTCKFRQLSLERDCQFTFQQYCITAALKSKTHNV